MAATPDALVKNLEGTLEANGPLEKPFLCHNAKIGTRSALKRALLRNGSRPEGLPRSIPIPLAVGLDRTIPAGKL